MSLQSSPSDSSSSEPSSPSGFPFDGNIYPTYQHMVAAKRERNRIVLQKSVDRLSSVFSSDSKNLDNSTRQSSKRRKRRPSNQSADGYAQTCRRNPKRAARGGTASSISSYQSADDSMQSSQRKPKRVIRGGAASSMSSHQSGDESAQPFRRKPKRGIRGATTSSISSQSHVSSSYASRRSRLKIPIPLVPDGQKEIRESCPQIGPGWIMRVRARNVMSSDRSPASDRVFISPSGKILRSLSHVDRFIERKSMRFLHENDANNIGATKKSRTSATVPDQVFVPSSVIEDVSAALDSTLMNGGRVQAREGILRDFVHSDAILGHAKKHGSNKEDGLPNRKTEEMTHLSDWKLYHPIIAQRDRQINEIDKRNNDRDNDNDTTCRFGSFIDDDDIDIPDKFLMENETISSPVTGRPRPHEQHPMLSGTLCSNDIVKYNNIIRKRHLYFTSKGPDCHWDQEFGDGIDPAVFVEECCRGKAAAAKDDMHAISTGGKKDGPEISKIDQGADAMSFMTKQYTSSLLQRCWDRAVHAASSTLTLSPAAGNQEGPKANLHENTEREDNDVKILNETDADCILRSDAMNVVDSLLDLLLANDNGNNLRQLFGSTQTEDRKADWRHVLNCLQTAARQGENKKGTGRDIQLNEKRYSIALDHISSKALSMRLAERYGTLSHRMPH